MVIPAGDRPGLSPRDRGRRRPADSRPGRFPAAPRGPHGRAGAAAESSPITERARWAAALLLAGRPEAVWTALQASEDNGMRTLLTLHLAAWRVPAEALLDRLEVEHEASARRALILALGHYRFDMLNPQARRRATNLVQAAFQYDPCPGVHSASRWTLGRGWGRSPLPEPRPPAGARWTEEAGIALAFVAPEGRPPFAIGMTEVTTAQFYRLCPEVRAEYHHREVRADDRPIVYVTQAQARVFCERLSEELKNHRTFRLPTQTEWEEAASAGARTARFHGEREEELGHFAWYVSNSNQVTHPVAELMPNDLGLFDVLGNVYEWHEPLTLSTYSEPITTRGGCFALSASQMRLRPSPLISKSPELGEVYTGFRIVRDLTPDELTTLTSSR